MRSHIADSGYVDFGVWNVTYASIDCSYWAGWKDKGALGSVPNHDPGVCCPAQVNETSMCPSYSEQPGILPPNTTTSATSMNVANIPFLATAVAGALWTLDHLV
jgi:hypothetical protein